MLTEINKPKFSYFLIIFSVLILLSCANGNLLNKTLSGNTGEPVIPREANKIFIQDIDCAVAPEFPGEELKLLLNESFIREGRLATVNTPDNCDLILKMKLIDYNIRNMKINSIGVPLEKRLNINVVLSLYDNKNKKTVINSRPVYAFRIFSESVHPIEPENIALRKCLAEMAGRITTAVLTGWYTDLMTPGEKGIRQ